MTAASESPRWRRAGALVAVGIGCAALLCLTYLFAVRTTPGQRLDQRGFEVLYALVPKGVPLEVLTWVARPAEIVVLAAVVLVLGVAAVGRHAWDAVLAAMVNVAISLTSTLYLRDDFLSRPYLTPDAFPANSLPSMHTSAATALGAAVLILWPGRRPDQWPWWLPSAVGLAVVVSAVGNVVSQAHRLSDVIASVLLVAIAAMVAAAALVWRAPRRASEAAFERMQAQAHTDR